MKLPWLSKKEMTKEEFNLLCRDVLSTSPIRPNKTGLMIVTKTGHLDMIMYLIAIKTFYRRIQGGEVVILNDDTLTAKDIDILKCHVSCLEIVNIKDINLGRCPPGVNRERLCFISDHVKDHYVIELDSDTITVGEIPEVIKCVEENLCFTLGGEYPVRPIKKICDQAQNSQSTDILTIAEKNFYKLKDYERLKYATGCGGFAGFARNSFSRERLEAISLEMQEIIGSSKWAQWGNDQVTSNFIVANSPSGSILPYPKYVSYCPCEKVNFGKSSFLHFIETNRFKNDFYIKTAKKMIREIK